MKRIICFAISFVLLTFGMTAFADNSVLLSKTLTEVTNTIKLLEIANGDQNGNMNYPSPVTRAEFVKMAVSASALKESAADSKLYVSLFPDVKNTYWGASYIHAAVNGKLINGYLDGTFRPNNKVKLEEAVTIVLKLLGYNSEDFLSPYPKGQLAKYKNLSLDANITAREGDNLTRMQCMQLLYNALSTKTKQGQVYCTTLGYKTGSDGAIDYNSLVESLLEGPYNVKLDTVEELIGFEKKDAVVYRNDKLSDFSEIKDNDVMYFNNELSTIWIYTEKAFGIIEKLLPNSINPTSAVIGGITYNFTSNVVGIENLKIDSFVMLSFDKNGNASNIVNADLETYEKYHNPETDSTDKANVTATEPVVVLDVSSWTKQIPFEVTDKTSITLDGADIKYNNIKLYDVCYYSPVFESLTVYRKMATGIFKAFNEGDGEYGSIDLSGKKYSFANNTVKNKFLTSGEFGKTNSFVTLLLGKNDTVVEAIAGNEAHISSNSENSSYFEIVEQTLSSPVHIKNIQFLSELQNEIPFDIEKAKVYLNGKACTYKSIGVNDIVYYSSAFEAIWCYRDYESGVIEEISSVASPSSVKLSGNSYKIETNEASYELSSFGKYRVGDYVTLLLGKEGGVVAVIPTEEMSNIVVGVVSELGTKEFTGSDNKKYNADFVSVISTDNVKYTYEYENRYFLVGDVVEIIFDSHIKINKAYFRNTNDMAVKIKKAIQEGRFASDCEILDFAYSGTKKIYQARISGADIDLTSFTAAGIVKYCSFNDDGEIEKLIFNDFTGDTASYAVATEVSGSSGSYSIEYLKDGSLFKTNSSSASPITASAIKVYKSSSGETVVKNLLAYVDAKKLTHNAVYDENDEKYLLSDDVQIYVLSKYESVNEISNRSDCEQSTIEEVLSGEYKYIRAYYDSVTSKGGRIRVIIASKN